jgi:T5SS/PEP-CTERM-associated repeat protein
MFSWSSVAQYTDNFQTNAISVVSSNWTGDYYVGSNMVYDALQIFENGVLTVAGDSLVGYYGGSENSLVISNGGGLFNGNGWVGSGANNNSAIVTDSGSVWSNGSTFYIGNGSSGNTLEIKNGAKVFAIDSLIGDGVYEGAINPGSNNTVLVTDPGSIWSAGVFLLIGGFGDSGDSLVISNTGVVVSDNGYIGPNGDNSSVLVTGPGSVWSNTAWVIVGVNSFYNQLVIASGGMVLDDYGFVGNTNDNNSVLVSGAGSAWSSSSSLSIGYGGSYNSLEISEGGMVSSGSGSIGATGSNNYVFVTGAGSVWSNGSTFYVGINQGGNSLVVSNGGLVSDGSALVGYGASAASNNMVRLVDGGMWRNGVLYVGEGGSSNSLVISGGSVSATNLVVGVASSTCNNVVDLNGGSLTVTNKGAGILEVRHGELVLNGGVLQADTLVITNSCAQFIHTGGTLIVSNVVLDPNLFRVSSITRQGNDLMVTWMMGPGTTNALQATSGARDGGYSTSGFHDLCTVLNNTTLGTVATCFDFGAATNVPAKYYRARLVP